MIPWTSAPFCLSRWKTGMKLAGGPFCLTLGILVINGPVVHFSPFYVELAKNRPVVHFAPFYVELARNRPVVHFVPFLRYLEWKWLLVHFSPYIRTLISNAHLVHFAPKTLLNPFIHLFTFHYPEFCHRLLSFHCSHHSLKFVCLSIVLLALSRLLPQRFFLRSYNTLALLSPLFVTGEIGNESTESEEAGIHGRAVQRDELLRWEWWVILQYYIFTLGMYYMVHVPFHIFLRHRIVIDVVRRSCFPF